MKHLDMTGKPCPIPVVETRKALAGDIAGVVVRVDNMVAVNNLSRMAETNDYIYSFKELAPDLYEVSIAKSATNATLISPEPLGEDTQVLPRAGSYTVVISRDIMGHGSEELGKILIKGFIYALSQQEKLPECLLFHNGGVHLVVTGANTVEDLKLLEKDGVEILSCGTCLNYFNLEEKLAVGKIIDMYGICSKMTEATKLVTI